MMILFCVVVGILLAGSYIIFYTLLAREVRAQLDRQIVATASPVAADLASDPTENDVDQLNLPGSYFEVISPSGAVAQRSINLRGGALQIPGKFPQSKPAFSTLFNSRYGKLRLGLVPFKRGAETQILVLAVPTEPADRALQAFRGLMLWILPLSLVATALVSGWYAGRSLRPVRLLTAHAAQMAGRIGQSARAGLWTPLPVDNPKDELGRLAETFNSLFAKIDTSVRQLRRFVTDAAHELRTPLSVLQGETELVLAKPRPGDEYEKALVTIDGELKKLSRIVEGLFTLSMADAGQLRLNSSALYLNEILEEACCRASLLARGKQISIDRDLRQDAACTGDEAFLRELFLIFLDNSIKYSPAGSTVSVRLEQQNGHFKITFQDQGIGIQPGDMPRIFERFYRAAPAAAGDSQSGGLGLSIAQAIAQAHGGSIYCMSEPGRGSTFTLTLRGSVSG
ncbi:MAG: HAMP domain-containing protein [Acidobacteriota bacterium]|nr:HAMP domain-containing protein [Acidobacteriota bacterium]